MSPLLFALFLNDLMIGVNVRSKVILLECLCMLMILLC